MRFFLINRPENVNLKKYFKLACEKYDVEFIELIAKKTDYLSLDVTSEDIVHRVTSEHKGQMIEKYLLTKNPTTFYKDPLQGIRKYDNVIESTIVHAANDIPVAKSVFIVPKDDKPALKKYVEYLGGFPIIIKVAGGSKGVGVMKVDSFSSLSSVVDYLNESNGKYILREFIDIGTPAHTYRAIVVGNEVVFSYKNESISSEDFRSNVNQEERNRSQIQLSEEEKAIIVKTVSVLNFELGGVDFLRRENGEMAILEVNTPFNFVPVIDDLEFPIHEVMVKYLIDKAENRG